ncbi:MAG: hypothetical protein R3B99_12200 [Polyangiales bacterium]
MGRAALIAACLCVAAPAAGQDAPIDGNDFAIDAVATPVLASSRITGLAGAYTALAEGIDGVPWNPASYASRSLWELDVLEYDLTASVLFSGSFASNDYFLNGRGQGFGIENFVFADVGARLQYGPIGGGVTAQVQFYDVPSDDGAPAASVSLVSIHGGGGYGLFDGQLVVGGGARAVIFDTSILDAEEAFSLQGAGLEVGSVFRHERLPFRVGAAFRTPVRSQVVTDDEMTDVPRQVAGLWRPRAVGLPWEVQVGGALQIGPRPLNRRFRPKKDLARGLRAELRHRQCEREREQVRRELEARSEPVPELRCPRLRVRARDRAWREAERQRVREEKLRMEDAIEIAEASVDDLWAELYEAMPRRHLLVSVDLHLLGPVEDAVGIDAFLEQTRRTRGDRWTTTFRLGVEGEPWPHRLKLRVGTYVEQPRYRGVTPRVHGTAGFDLRLFPLFGRQWRATFVVDGARDYVSWGVSVGVWH